MVAALDSLSFCEILNKKYFSVFLYLHFKNKKKIKNVIIFIVIECKLFQEKSYLEIFCKFLNLEREGWT